MIYGAHVILYSKDADADRAFFRDVLKYPYADAGHGWLIFALPPAEVAMHPSDENDVHELYLMCDDVHALIAEMKAKNVACSPSTRSAGARSRASRSPAAARSASTSQAPLAAEARERRLAGHVETGNDSVTDPALGT